MDEDEFDLPLLVHEDGNDAVSKPEMRERKLQLRDQFHKRENRRIRNSVSFRLGVLLTRSVKRPWMLLLLPITMLNLFWKIGNERLGRHNVPFPDTPDEALVQQPRKDCIVLFPTNGVGFGHFTRMYALAKRLQKHSPDTEIVFFTTMPTLQILYNDGFPTYHLAGRKKYRDMSSAQWNALLEEHLSLIFNQHRPKMFIFDGAYPYRGMLNGIRSQSSMEKVWLRRGMFKKGANIPVDSIEHFSLIVRPGDGINSSEGDTVNHQIETISIPPMLLMDESSLLSREDALARLNIEVGKKVIYVQLGAGRINDIDSEIRMTLDALLSQESIQIVLGESMLGDRISFTHPRIRLLRDYPNSIYFNAFDASIQAGGYNSFHEMRTFGIPTLFYPNMSTGMDDQLARCKVAEAEGWGIVLESRTPKNIKSSFDKLLTLDAQRSKEAKNGADDLAALLLDRVG